MLRSRWPPSPARSPAPCPSFPGCRLRSSFPRVQRGEPLLVLDSPLQRLKRSATSSNCLPAFCPRRPFQAADVSSARDSWPSTPLAVGGLPPPFSRACANLPGSSWSRGVGVSGPTRLPAEQTLQPHQVPGGVGAVPADGDPPPLRPPSQGCPACVGRGRGLTSSWDVLWLQLCPLALLLLL